MHTLKSVFTALCAASIFCAQAQKTFKNPVYNQDTPDPTVVRAPDGTFYAYGTGGTCRKSTNLYTWTNVGNALSRPTWNDTTYVDANGQKKGLLIQSEPQLWYNITKNFSVGTEFEISNNFIYPTCETTKTFYFNPTLGVKFNL